MKLGRALKLIRIASGMKQKHVAARLGVTPNYVSLVENGKREPSVSFLKDLARLLDVPVGIFFLWEEPGTRPSKKSLNQLRNLLAHLEAMYVFANRSTAKGKRIAA